MKNLLALILLLSAVLVSCSKEKEPDLFPGGKGLFILNEGNYLAGNGSLSFYSSETKSIYNDLFSAKNIRTLGDIPTFLATDNGTGYIIVNNSGTIEKIDMETLESLGTITGLTSSPRQMVIYNGKGYVSSLYTNNITIIDLAEFDVEGQIDIGCTSEALKLLGSTLFAANWSGGSKIVAVDLLTKQFQNIVTGMEPESMVLDKYNKLWVLCTGGWNNEEIPQICKINTSTLAVETTLSFRTNTDNPSSLTINSTGDTLYYIDEGIRRMPISASSLPSDVIVSPGTSLFYKVAPAPWKGNFYVTDAVDYQQTGRLMVFDKNGTLIDTENTGIIPGFMYFTE
jgi:DNA-binding beta-propeller fold protein YncE